MTEEEKAAAAAAAAKKADTAKQFTVDPVEFARLQAKAAQTDALIAKSRKQDAEIAIEGAIRQGRIVPAMRAQFTALHIQAAKDDEALGTRVDFSDGEKVKEGTRVEAFEAAVAAMPKSVLTRELVPGQDHVVQAFADDSDERKDLKEQARKSATEYATQANKNGR